MIAAALIVAASLAVPEANLRLNDLTAEWEKGPEPIVWGFHNLYNARIVHEPEAEFPYKMWFFGYAAQDNNPRYHGGDIIYHARAKALDAWEIYAGGDQWTTDMDPHKYAPVLRPSPEAFDNMASGDPSVLRHKGLYHMAYSGVRFETRDGKLYKLDVVMGATSEDGIHWTRTQEPLLQWPKERTIPWELKGEGISPRPEGYYGGYHRPSLMFDEGRWKIWFDYYPPDGFLHGGYAENCGEFTVSQDWKVLRAEDKPVLRNWPNTSVVRHGGTYYAFSDAPYYPPELGGDGRQITMATSKDGLSWTVLGHIRPEGQASSHVPEAIVLKDSGVPWLYVFYAWKPARKEGEAWDYRYKQVRWIRKRLDAVPAAAR